MSRCDCGDPPVMIANAPRVEPRESPTTVTPIEDDTASGQSAAFTAPARLRGPPPDLVVVHSTILLV